MQWWDAFARDDFGPVERRCKRGTRHYMTITFDGSLTGGGATLRAGVTNVKEANIHPVITYWHGKWSDALLWWFVDQGTGLVLTPWCRGLLAPRAPPWCITVNCCLTSRSGEALAAESDPLG